MRWRWRSLGRRPRGLAVNSVLLSTLLVVATAVAVGLAIVQVLGQQVEEAADRRLVDGAAFFQANLDDIREDLTAAGAWLLRDPAFLAAVRTGQVPDLEERLGLALRLKAVDEALVADPSGTVLARLRVGGAPVHGGAVGDQAGFRQASGGAASTGLARSEAGFPQQEIWLPLPAAAGDRPPGVLRLASFLDQADLDRFRARTGLDASLFLGEARLVTTLRQPSGAPLTDVAADPTTLAAVVGGGRELHAWRDLPIGRVRSYYVPVRGPDGRRVGMVSVAIPLAAIRGTWRDALLPVLPLLGLVILAGAGLAWLLARQVRAPVLALAHAAARLRDGDLATPIPPVREVDLAPLAEELERARASVQASLQVVASEEARQRALLAALREPILTATPEGQITDFNPAATALFGSAARLRGRAIGEVLPCVAVPAAEVDGEMRWSGQVIDAAGRVLDVEVARTRLSEGYRPASDVYVVHDVSHHAELSRLREQLLYDVAHELRAPLAVLDNALEILAVDSGALTMAEFGRLVGSARRTTARLRSLMEDLLSVGSIQAGRLLVTPRPTPVAGLVAEAIEAVEGLTGPRGLRIEQQVPDSDLAVLADGRYARQALVNLLANAAKFSPPDERIVVRAEPTDGQVRLSVEDRGPGIPAERQAGLFQRFYRLRPSHAEPGIGLGLAIAKGIVEAHGGAIGIDSAPGAGTRVWLTLPRAREGAA